MKQLVVYFAVVAIVVCLHLGEGASIPEDEEAAMLMWVTQTS